MIKRILILMFIFGLITCKPSTDMADYFGQALPDSVPVIFAPEVISLKGRLEHGISFSPDGTELAFGVLHSNDKYRGSMHYSKRVDTKWSEIVNPTFIGEGSFFLPYFTPDGKSLLYAKSNPDNAIYDYSDIWMVTKKNSTYSKPVKLDIPVSSNDRDASASMTSDGAIYVASGRAHTVSQGWSDIYRSDQINGNYTECKVVEVISSGNDEESVFISPDDNYLITCRYSNATGADLYISYRNKENNWIEPQIVDTIINSYYWDRRPFVTIDNEYLFFTRSQIGGNGIIESDIYWSNTSKLFKPFVYNALADTTVRAEEKFELSIPSDYFKDIDDNRLNYRLNASELAWLEFDSENMKLSGLPPLEGWYELTFTASDKFSNVTEAKFILTVVE